MNTWNRHIHTGTQNVHNFHNTHIDSIGIPKHKKHLRLLSSGTKLFITFELKGFSTEGERHNLSILAFPSAPRHVRHLPQGHHPGFGKPRKSTVFSRGRTQLTDFSQISAHNPPCTLPVHNVIHIPLVIFSIWDFYFDICERHILPRVHQHLHSSLHLTKPKGKIYKTKSLSHYITTFPSRSTAEK